MGGVSALSVISLRRNGISTTSTIPTARLPAPSSAKSFTYPGLVATAVVPVGSGIIPEKSPAKSDARPVTSIQLPIITRSEEHTSELQSRVHLVCRLLLEKKNR